MEISDEKIQKFRQAALLRLCQRVLWLCGRGSAKQEEIQKYVDQVNPLINISQEEMEKAFLPVLYKIMEDKVDPVLLSLLAKEKK
jgi:hypothetical protein